MSVLSFAALLRPSLNSRLFFVIEGGSADPEANYALAAVIKRARSQGVPKDNIDKAIKKVRVSLFLKLYFVESWLNRPRGRKTLGSKP